MQGDLTRSCGEIRWREQGDPLAELEGDFNWQIHHMLMGLENFIDEWQKVKTRWCLRWAVRKYAEEQRVQRTFTHWLRRTFDPDRC